MPTLALILVSDENSILQACRGWLPPCEPELRATLNPFTQDMVETETDVPDRIDECLECAGLEEVCENLALVKPVCIDVCLSHDVGFHETAEPVLYGYEQDLGPIPIQRVRKADETEVSELFGDRLGEYSDPVIRKQFEYSIFVFVYSF